MAQDFALVDTTTFSRAVTALQPGATGSDLVRLLNGKAKRTTALDWLAGRYHAPAWALHMLADALEHRTSKQQMIINEIRQTKERPGKRAGALNLAKYLASHNRDEH